MKELNKIFISVITLVSLTWFGVYLNSFMPFLPTNINATINITPVGAAYGITWFLIAVFLFTWIVVDWK